MLRILTALILLATIVPIAEAQCPTCVARPSRTVQYLPVPTAYRVVTASPQSVTPTPQYPTTDVYGFGLILNAKRRQYYRPALVYDPALSAIAAANSSKGWGHHHLHKGRENVGVGSLDAVMSQWLSSPAHADALLDSSLSRYGIAQVNGIWTYCGAR